MEGARLLFIVLVCNSLVRRQHAQDDPDQFVVDMIQSKHQYVDTTGRRNSSPLNDTGHAEICGPENATLEFSWKPKVVSQSSEVYLTAYVVAPVSLLNATVFGDVYIPQVKSKIFEYKYIYTCEDLQKKYYFRCPVKKGQIFHATNVPSKLKNMPVGNFIIHGEVKNEKDETFICFKIDLHVIE